jgi:hypothetical protein
MNEPHLTYVVRLMTVDPSGITFSLRRPFLVNDEAIFPASQYISFRPEHLLIIGQHRFLMTYFASMIDVRKHKFQVCLCPLYQR